MLFDRSLSTFRMTSLKHYMEYFNIRCQIQLDVPVGGERHRRHGQHEHDHAEGRVVDAHGGRLDEPLEVL